MNKIDLSAIALGAQSAMMATEQDDHGMARNLMESNIEKNILPLSKKNQSDFSA